MKLLAPLQVTFLEMALLIKAAMAFSTTEADALKLFAWIDSDNSFDGNGKKLSTSSLCGVMAVSAIDKIPAFSSELNIHHTLVPIVRDHHSNS